MQSEDAAKIFRLLLWTGFIKFIIMPDTVIVLSSSIGWSGEEGESSLQSVVRRGDR